MSAIALLPRIRIMAICDGIKESKIETGVFHLKGVRHSIFTEGFPLVPDRLWLFLVFSCPRPGRHPCYVRILNDRNGRTVFSSYLRPMPTFAVDRELSINRARIRCAFPEAGTYAVQVWFFQKHGNDVLKGEMPFSVFEMES